MNDDCTPLSIGITRSECTILQLTDVASQPPVLLPELNKGSLHLLANTTWQRNQCKWQVCRRIGNLHNPGNDSLILIV